MKKSSDNGSGHPGSDDGPIDGEKVVILIENISRPEIQPYLFDLVQLSKDFMGIYHEKQIGSLCAVHCLNNVVQGPYFNEVAMGEIGQHLDRYFLH